MMELSEDFIKLLQTAFLVVGTLTIFLIFIQYNITIINNEARREAYVIGDSLLGSKCLAETYYNGVIKSLFSEDKINEMSSGSSCIKYIDYEVNITLSDKSKTWFINLGLPKRGGEAEFIVAVKMTDGEVKPAKMTVKV
jgi:hypothetical protein